MIIIIVVIISCSMNDDCVCIIFKYASFLCIIYFRIVVWKVYISNDNELHKFFTIGASITITCSTKASADSKYYTDIDDNRTMIMIIILMLPMIRIIMELVMIIVLLIIFL